MNNHDYYINDFKQSKKNLNSNKNQTQQTLKYQEDELSSKQNLYSYNSEVNYFKKNLSNNKINSSVNGQDEKGLNLKKNTVKGIMKQGLDKYQIKSIESLKSPIENYTNNRKTPSSLTQNYYSEGENNFPNEKYNFSLNTNKVKFDRNMIKKTNSEHSFRTYNTNITKGSNANNTDQFRHIHNKSYSKSFKSADACRIKPSLEDASKIMCNHHCERNFLHSYLKSSKKVSEYIIKNRKQIKLYGNEHYTNKDPIEFIEKSATEYPEIGDVISHSIFKNHNYEPGCQMYNSKNHIVKVKEYSDYIKENNKIVGTVSYKIVEEQTDPVELTPIPAKSRKMMKNKIEKNEFIEVERNAVYMRRWEYTHNLFNKKTYISNETHKFSDKSLKEKIKTQLKDYKKNLDKQKFLEQFTEKQDFEKKEALRQLMLDYKNDKKVEYKGINVKNKEKKRKLKSQIVLESKLNSNNFDNISRNESNLKPVQYYQRKFDFNDIVETTQSIDPRIQKSNGITNKNSRISLPNHNYVGFIHKVIFIQRAVRRYFLIKCFACEFIQKHIKGYLIRKRISKYIEAKRIMQEHFSNLKNIIVSRQMRHFFKNLSLHKGISYILKLILFLQRSLKKFVERTRKSNRKLVINKCKPLVIKKDIRFNNRSDLISTSSNKVKYFIRKQLRNSKKGIVSKEHSIATNDTKTLKPCQSYYDAINQYQEKKLRHKHSSTNSELSIFSKTAKQNFNTLEKSIKDFHYVIKQKQVLEMTSNEYVMEFTKVSKSDMKQDNEQFSYISNPKFSEPENTNVKIIFINKENLKSCQINKTILDNKAKNMISKSINQICFNYKNFIKVKSSKIRVKKTANVKEKTAFIKKSSILINEKNKLICNLVKSYLFKLKKEKEKEKNIIPTKKPLLKPYCINKKIICISSKLEEANLIKIQKQVKTHLKIKQDYKPVTPLSIKKLNTISKFEKVYKTTKANTNSVKLTQGMRNLTKTKISKPQVDIKPKSIKYKKIIQGTVIVKKYNFESFHKLINNIQKNYRQHLDELRNIDKMGDLLDSNDEIFNNINDDEEICGGDVNVELNQMKVKGGNTQLKNQNLKPQLNQIKVENIVLPNKKLLGTSLSYKTINIYHSKIHFYAYMIVSSLKRAIFNKKANTSLTNMFNFLALNKYFRRMKLKTFSLGKILSFKDNLENYNKLNFIDTLKIKILLYKNTKGFFTRIYNSKEANKSSTLLTKFALWKKRVEFLRQGELFRSKMFLSSQICFISLCKLKILVDYKVKEKFFKLLIKQEKTSNKLLMLLKLKLWSYNSQKIKENIKLTGQRSNNILKFVNVINSAILKYNKRNFFSNIAISKKIGDLVNALSNANKEARKLIFEKLLINSLLKNSLYSNKYSKKISNQVKFLFSSLQ